MEDERRVQFPYNNIPTYHTKGITYSNQLFDYEQPYIVIADGKVSESYVVKNNKGALLVNQNIPILEGTFYKNREELEAMFKQPDNEQEKQYIVDREGNFYNSNEVLETEEQIVEWAKKRISYQYESYKKGTNSKLSYFDEFGLKNLKKCIDNMTIDDVPNVILPNDKIVIKTDGKDIYVQSFSIEFIEHDYYRVNVSCYPISKYTVEQIMSLNLNLIEQKKRKISLLLNSEISKEDIETAKKLEKILNK